MPESSFPTATANIGRKNQGQKSMVLKRLSEARLPTGSPFLKDATAVEPRISGNERVYRTDQYGSNSDIWGTGNLMGTV